VGLPGTINPPTNANTNAVQTKEPAVNSITQFLVTNGTPLLFAIVLVEQAGLPLPAAPWLLAAGALAASGQLNLFAAVTLTALACIIPDWTWFYIGRRRGQGVSRLFCRLSLNPNNCVHRSKGLIGRRGLEALVFAKFIPGIGAVMPPLAGALGVSTTRFLFFDGLGSLLYSGSYISAGFLFHNQLQTAVAVLSDIGLSALILLLGVVVTYIALKYARRRRVLARVKTAVTPAAAPELNPAFAPVLLVRDSGNTARHASALVQMSSSADV
jgi:membrane protein DedA with SNARE-associated domain